MRYKLGLFARRMSVIVVCVVCICLTAGGFSLAVAEEKDYTYTEFLRQKSPWTPTHSAAVIERALPNLTRAQKLSAVTYLHVIGEESGRKTGKHFYFVVETARRAHVNGLSAKDISAWIKAAADDYNANGEFSKAYYWGRSLLQKEDVGNAADALTTIGNNAASTRAKAVGITGLFLNVVNDTNAFDWVASSFMSPYGTLDKYVPNVAGLDNSQWNTLNLAYHVVTASKDDKYRQHLENAANLFGITNVGINSSVNELLESSTPLRTSFENLQNFEGIQSLDENVDVLKDSVDGLVKDVEQMVQEYANDFNTSLEILVKEAESAEQQRRRDSKYQQQISNHRQTFAGVNLALNVASLFSDSPQLQKISEAVSVFEQLSKSGIDAAFGNITPLEMTNMYLVGAKVLMGLMSSGGQSFEGAVMAALSQISEKLADVHRDLQEFRLENRDAHRLTHTLLMDLHDKFEIHRYWSEMNAEEISSRMRDVSDQLSVANNAIRSLTDEVRQGFFQLVKLDAQKRIGICLRKKDQVSKGASIPFPEFKVCAEEITSWIFDVKSLVESGPVSKVGGVEEPAVLALEVKQALGPGILRSPLPRSRRDLWLTSSHAYIQFLRDWPEHHLPTVVNYTQDRYRSEVVLDQIIAFGKELESFPRNILGLDIHNELISFDKGVIDAATGALTEKAERWTFKIFERADQLSSSVTYGINPFRYSEDRSSYFTDLQKPIFTQELAVAIEKRRIDKLIVRNCFKPDGDLAEFKFDAQILKVFPAAVVLDLIEGRKVLSACLDFSQFTSPGSVRHPCPLPDPEKEWTPGLDRFLFDGVNLPIVPLVFEMGKNMSHQFEVGWWSSENGGVQYNRGKRPPNYCTSFKNYSRPFVGTTDGSDENYVYSAHHFINDLGGRILIRFSVSNQQDDEESFSGYFEVEADPANFSEKVRGKWGSPKFEASFARFRGHVNKHVQDTIKRAQISELKSGERPGLAISECRLREGLQAKLLDASLNTQAIVGSRVETVSALFADAQRALSHIIWVGALSPLIASLSEEDRAEIARDLTWISKESPLGRDVVRGVTTTDCEGIELIGSLKRGTLEEQIGQEYSRQVSERVERIFSKLSENNPNEGRIRSDPQVSRTLDQLIILRDWIVTDSTIK